MGQYVELKYDRFRLNDDEFYDFCTQNYGLKFERDAKGNILIMPNTGGITGNLNFELNIEFGIVKQNLEKVLIHRQHFVYQVRQHARRTLLG